MGEFNEGIFYSESCNAGLKLFLFLLVQIFDNANLGSLCTLDARGNVCFFNGIENGKIFNFINSNCYLPAKLPN